MTKAAAADVYCQAGKPQLFVVGFNSSFVCSFSIILCMKLFAPL